MPPKTPESVRQAIIADIREGITSGEPMSTRKLGSVHGVSDATVRKIAKDEGLVDAFSREGTEKATRARLADMKADRTRLAADLLVDARRLRERAWSEYKYYERSAEGLVRVTLDLPPLGEVRNAYTALGIGVDKHLALIRQDSDDGSESGRSMLGALAAGLQVAYERLGEGGSE